MDQEVLFFQRHRGLTLTELLVVLSLLAITLTCALPGFATHRDQLRLKSASAQLISDLQWARTEAGLRNLAVRWHWQAHPQGNCYILHIGNSTHCQCSPLPARCEPGGTVLKSMQWRSQDQIALQSNVASIRFDPTLGTSTPTARLKLTTQRGLSIDHVVNVMGRIRTCSTRHNPLGLPEC